LTTILLSGSIHTWCVVPFLITRDLPARDFPSHNERQQA
jgi:hypothetical protein